MAPALLGPTFSAPPSSILAMEPPPAPMVLKLEAAVLMAEPEYAYKQFYRKICTINGTILCGVVIL